MKKQVKKIIIDKKGEKVFKFKFDQDNSGTEMVVIILALLPGNYRIMLKIDHDESETKGKILVRAVVGKKANLLVDGLIRIKKKLKGVDSSLEMRSLVLGEKAKVEMRPSLEVLANEVRVAHQATITRLSEEQIFYLMSRGLEKKEAKRLLVRGFLGFFEESDEEWRKIETCLK